ncbi:torsin-like protein [Contarinia nasturtii]|uniref:torsin-like protein n=1 Tax=Contarinia nasturtii TaxID=265458 RepID=UPI0012D4B56A|nr:torsin-like protein [Contarinia nasturtii]
MHLNLIVQQLVFSIFLINIVECFEPITMTALGTAVAGAGYWLFGDGGTKRREKVADTLNYCSYYECCTPKHIVYDIEGLKADLQKKLFGQHIVNATLIPALRAHVKNLHKSEKPLVMSFHGNIGTGKNHVADLIIKHFYKAGENSTYVYKYRARKDFPVESEVDQYRVKLMDDISKAIKKCARSIFVFDEVEKIPAGVFESIASILDYHSHVSGMDFRQAIFIFLTNAGGDEIAHALDKIMEKGTFREQTKMNDFEYIAEIAAYNIKGGLKKSSIITSGLIDHFLPFLPLERRHIENCVRAEFEKLNREPEEDEISHIIEEYVSYQGLFSKYGCKRLNKKIQAMTEEW